MDIERRIELVTKSPTEEVLVPEELRSLLQTHGKINAYNGFEPSGMAHLGTGLICAYKMKDFVEAKINFKVYLATWHAWINNKLGGDMELIKKAALHFKHSWLSLGVPEDKVEFVYADELYDNGEYWKKMIGVAKNMTLARGARTLEIMGRKEKEAQKISDYIYTPMQVADIFEMDIHIAQLGMDQRKANVVAREVAEALGYKKPICVHHHLLQGLVKPAVWPIPKGQEKEILSEIKMTKSKPNTAVFIYDSPEEIRAKITGAFCPEKETNYNPIIDFCRHIIFREFDTLNIERPTNFGGNLELQSFDELARMYETGKLHPQDLKKAVAESLVKILEPSRKYFDKNREAREGLEVIRKAKVTR